jgi:hypothetical protein
MKNVETSKYELVIFDDYFFLFFLVELSSLFRFGTTKHLLFSISFVFAQ